VKRTFTALGIGLALLLGAAACAQPGAGAGAGSAATGVRLDAEPLGAALVTPSFGWVLTDHSLLLTGDGGKSFAAAKLSLPDGPARAAYFADARHGWVAAAAGTGITVARTADGGGTWTNTTLTGTDEVGSLSVGFGDDNRGAILAGRQTSSNFSMGTLWSTVDAGRTWKPSRAPVNGTVTVDGTGAVWLAGGVFGNQLFGSANAGRSWTAQKLQVGSGTVESVSAPAAGVVTATVTNGPAARISMLRAGTDGTWTEHGSVALAADPGVAPPLARYASTVMMIDPSGKHLYRGAGTAAGAVTPMSTVDATGLPVGASQASFVDTNSGWVLSSFGTCAGHKTDCTYTTQVTSTTDSGRSWQPIATYQR
jgi:hypothetical protein